jgi:DNA-directed RNA polymerase subunit RPC12/RpoP
MAQLIGNGKQPIQPPKPKIDLSQAKEITCQNCNGSIFLPANKFLTVPKIAAGTPQDLLIPVEVYVCGDCGELCEELLPKEFQSKK